MMEEAEELARDAGVDCPGIAFWHYEDLEKLLAAEGWDDPAEVLQPGDEETSLLGHRRLIRMIDVDLAVSGLPPGSYIPTLVRVDEVFGRYVDLVDLDRETPFTRYLKNREGLLRRVA